jgi:hypothetical protein
MELLESSLLVLLGFALVCLADTVFPFTRKLSGWIRGAIGETD